MSSFTGKFREYPSISADNFEKENLDSVAFFLSHCHKDHMSGLDSSAFHQRLMSSKTAFVYCSETTQNLLMYKQSYIHLKDYIRSIPLEQQTMIPLFDEKTEEQNSICVTLLPAGHCVGSVMFLFEGQHGNVLYTGDFRLAKGDVKRIPFFHANGRIKDIKSIYVDTTFCLPKMNSLPSREQSRDAIIELIDRWFSRGPEYAVSLLCKGMYGFEYLLKEVAMNYKTKIHVSVERLAMYRYLPDMTRYFTTDGRSTRIHSCKWETKRLCDSDLPCGLSVQPSLKMKVLRIKPTTMWVARDTEPMPTDYKRYDKGKRLWRVVHSMHASMEEIQDLVGYLRPYHVYPNVPPAGMDTLEDAFERLRGLTRLHECDSCNQDESGDDCFREQAACHNAEEKKNAEQKAAPVKLQLRITRPVPDEKVLAQCKELGIEEDEILAPVPKRRKTKATNIVLEEKISIARQQPTVASPCSDGTSRNLSPLMSSHTTPLPGPIDDDPKNGCEVRREGRTKSAPGVLESRNTFPLEGCHAMPLPVLRDNTIKGSDEDYADRREKHPQFEQTTTNACRTAMRAEDDNEIIHEVTNEQLKASAQSRTKEPDVSYSWNSIDGAVGRQSDGAVGRQSDDAVDKNTAQSNTTEFDEKSSQNPDMTKQQGHLLPGSNNIDKNTGTESLTSSTRSSGLKENFIQGGVRADFDVPPSPGHVEPCLDKLSSIHQIIQNAEPHSMTKILKF